LYVKDSIVRENNHSGIYIEPPVGTTAQVSIDNTRTENNVLFGIYFFARAKGTINRSVASGGSFGFAATNGNTVDPANASVVTISNSVTSQNGTYGISAWGTGTKALVQESTASNSLIGFTVYGGAQMSIQHCASLDNGNGVNAQDAGTFVRVSNSTITNSTVYGFYQSNGAVFESRGNNTVRGNNPDTAGIITVIAGT
jgi:hypothetical protein